MIKKQTKYIFVTGGVLSGVGKGITAASIGNVLKARGLTVNIQKCDPYLNVDAGTLNPAEHGECFVTTDGAETDLDLGHYERFLDVELTQASSTMSGRILKEVIEDERSGKYLGKTVQYIPHVTRKIQDKILEAGEGFDVHIVEVGGTVGDIEGQAFMEAIRELGTKLGSENSLYVHVVYVPYLGASGEFKTKPAQNAIKELRNTGITANMLAVRTEEPAPESVKRKLSLLGGVAPESIVLLPNANSIYQVPLTIEDSGFAKQLCSRLSIKNRTPKLREWRKMVDSALAKNDRTVRVGVAAKYLDNDDSYFSVLEALRSAAWAEEVNVDIVWVDTEAIDSGKLSISKLKNKIDGVVVPGGFGYRGVEGKIKVAGWALKNGTPYLGLCLGMQVAVIAAVRDRLSTKDKANVNSTEFDPKCSLPIITTMDDQLGKEGTGGTMRLGSYECDLATGSLASKLYGKRKIQERHRHRYEFNNEHLSLLQQSGLRPSGTNIQSDLVEIVESPSHPFFIASQFHPEFLSRPSRPHPLFLGFIKALKKQL